MLDKLDKLDKLVGIVGVSPSDESLHAAANAADDIAIAHTTCRFMNITFSPRRWQRDNAGIHLARGGGTAIRVVQGMIAIEEGGNSRFFRPGETKRRNC